MNSQQPAPTNSQLDATIVELDRADEQRPPEFSDEALAECFADQYDDQLRYVALWSQWMVFDIDRWKRDETRLAFNLARSVCRAAAANSRRTSNKQRVAECLASAKTRAAVVTLANDDRRIAATAEQWDSAPDLLNTPKETNL